MQPALDISLDNPESLENFSDRLLIVGCGTMVGAMLQRWLDSGLSPALVEIVNPSRPSFHPTIACYSTMQDWAAHQDKAAHASVPDWIMLGVKPQIFRSVAQDVAHHLPPKTYAKTAVLSILAGVSIEDLQHALPSYRGYVQVLPNMAARIGKSVSAVAMQDISPSSQKKLHSLLRQLGDVVAMRDDKHMDLVTAYTGSGPAFVARLIEIYAAAGERLGLSPQEAMKLALATFGGTSDILRTDALTPAALISKVASKGGVTRAGLDVLEGDADLTLFLTEALRTARNRVRSLAEEARGEAKP